jgi:uncharacterized protein (DUF3820 family)
VRHDSQTGKVVDVVRVAVAFKTDAGFTKAYGRQLLMIIEVALGGHLLINLPFLLIFSSKLFSMPRVLSLLPLLWLFEIRGTVGLILPLKNSIS